MYRDREREGMGRGTRIKTVRGGQVEGICRVGECGEHRGAMRGRGAGA